MPGDTHTNVLVDLDCPAGYTGNKDEMLAAMCQFVHEQDPKYSCVVKVEQSYLIIQKMLRSSWQPTRNKIPEREIISEKGIREKI